MRGLPSAIVIIIIAVLCRWPQLAGPLAEADEEVQRECVRMMECEELTAPSMLFMEGSLGDKLYVVLTGALSVVAGGQVRCK
jgi:CRP-like cAMP-binding protein